MANVNTTASYLNNIEPLNGANFHDWKDKVIACLAWNELDVALRFDKPAAPAEGQQPSEAFTKWERSNRMAIMVMTQTISAGIRGAIPLKDSEGRELSAKAFLASIEENFKSSSKTFASTLIMKMVTSQYNGKTGIREHILSMCDMTNKLKDMDMSISDGFLVHFIMTSLPSQYSPFKINYNTNKGIWTVTELISYCVEEEERHKTEKMKDVVNMVHYNNQPKNQHESGSSKQGQKKFKKGWNKKLGANKNNSNNNGNNNNKNNSKPKERLCLFCKSPNHLQKDCDGFKEWLKEQGKTKVDVVSFIDELFLADFSLILGGLTQVQLCTFPIHCRYSVQSKL